MIDDYALPRAACSDCGTALPTEPVEPCPNCGSLRRDGFAYAGTAKGVGKAHNPEVRAREPRLDYHGGRLSKPAMERRGGLSLTREDGIERLRRRVYDRLHDHYEETVYNPDGSVYYHTWEPLSRHRRSP